MTTQVSFTADLDLKKQALEKARREGITLKTLLIYAMKGFVEGKISLSLEATNNKPDVEEINFTDAAVNEKAEKLANLLK